MSGEAAQLLEGLAVVLAVAYLVLAMRQNIVCWAAAFVSAGIYIVVFFDVTLYMESALQIFYLVMAVYGWWRWRGGALDSGLLITRWPWQRHVAVIVAVLAVSAFNGYWLASHTDAAMPYLDSLTTWSSVATTWMVTAKILENWLYWIVVDLCSIYLYVERGLTLTAGLFALYVVLAVAGYFIWRADYLRQSPAGSANGRVAADAA